MTARERPSAAALAAVDRLYSPEPDMTNAAPMIYDAEPRSVAALPLTPLAMIDRALSSGAGIDVIERLMTLQERWEANQGRKAFDAAIASAKAELPAIVKNQTASRGNAGSYRYEDLAQIAAQIDPVLGRYGLSYRFRTETDKQTIRVTCIISHRDGYSEETTLESAPDASGAKNPIQAMGSAVTYLQRYTLKAALGLAAAKDDDSRATERVAEAAPAQINADQFRDLRARIDAQGDEDGKLTGYLCGKFAVDTLAEIDTAQLATALAMLAKRAQTKGAA